MELKRTNFDINLGTEVAFNRTFMELKPYNGRNGQKVGWLLIAPLWN